MFLTTEIIVQSTMPNPFEGDGAHNKPATFWKYSFNFLSTSWLLKLFYKQKLMVSSGLQKKFSVISFLQVLQYSLSLKWSIYFLHALVDIEYNILLHVYGIFQIVKDNWALEAK